MESNILLVYTLVFSPWNLATCPVYSGVVSGWLRSMYFFKWREWHDSKERIILQFKCSTVIEQPASMQHRSERYYSRPLSSTGASDITAVLYAAQGRAILQPSSMQHRGERYYSRPLCSTGASDITAGLHAAQAERYHSWPPCSTGASDITAGIHAAQRRTISTVLLSSSSSQHETVFVNILSKK